MKKLSAFFATVLFVALGFVSCNKVDNGSNKDDNGGSGGNGIRVMQLAQRGTYNSGSSVSIDTAKLSYDTQGRVVKVSVLRFEGQTAETYETTFTYGNGNITATNQDGEQYIATLDAGGKVSQMIYTYDDGTGTINTVNIAVTYDSGGYIKTATAANDYMTYGGNYIWSGGNITSGSGSSTINVSTTYSGTITYTDKTYSGNLCLEYLTGVMSSAGEISVDLDVFGLLGFCGQRCANLPKQVQTKTEDGYGSSVDTNNYTYTFNGDGTVKTITEDEDGLETLVTTFSYE